MKNITIYPSPFTQRVSVEITSDVNENLIVSMTNDQDRIIKMFSWHVRPGTNTTSIDGLGSLPSGSYCILVKNIDGTIQHKNVLHKEG